VAQRDALSSLLQPQVLHDDDDKPIPTSIVNIVDNTVLYFIRSSYGTGIITSCKLLAPSLTLEH